MVQKVCKIGTNFGNFYIQNVLKTYYKEKKKISHKKGGQLNSWQEVPIWKIEKMEKVPLDI